MSAAKKKTERYVITASPLYGLSSHARLVTLLNWAGTSGQLRTFARRPDNYSRYIDRKSKPGKERLIEAPGESLKAFQARILDLLIRIGLPPYLHSARPGHSYLSNSAAHCKEGGCTITMDINSFYESVSVHRVARFFELELKCAPDVAQTIANLLCCDGHLATGSPASPLISFWAHKDAFDDINARVASRKGTFTLYIDDMAITGHAFGHTDIAWVKRRIQRAGLSIKDSKTRVFRAGAPKLVTGRAARNGQSRAPNKQHLKMHQAKVLLDNNPDNKLLRASVAGLKRHLALLDDVKREVLRSEAAEISKSKH